MKSEPLKFKLAATFRIKFKLIHMTVKKLHTSD